MQDQVVAHGESGEIPDRRCRVIRVFAACVVLGDHLVEVCVDLVTRFLHTFARAEKLPSSCAVGMRSRTFRKLV